MKRMAAIALFGLIGCGTGPAQVGTTTDDLLLFKPKPNSAGWQQRMNLNMDRLDKDACVKTSLIASNFSVGHVVFIDTTTDQVDLADASLAGTAIHNGFVTEDITGGGTAGNTIAYQVCGFLENPVITGGGSLTVGSLYYVSDTAGEIQATPGTVSALVGRAENATTLLMFAPETQIGGGGAGVTGPGSSDDNAISRFNGVGGSVIQNSDVTISDAPDPIIAASGVHDLTVQSPTALMIVDGATGVDIDAGSGVIDVDAQIQFSNTPGTAGGLLWDNGVVALAMQTGGDLRLRARASTDDLQLFHGSGTSALLVDAPLNSLALDAGSAGNILLRVGGTQSGFFDASNSFISAPVGGSAALSDSTGLLGFLYSSTSTTIRAGNNADIELKDGAGTTQFRVNDLTGGGGIDILDDTAMNSNDLTGAAILDTVALEADTIVDQAAAGAPSFTFGWASSADVDLNANDITDVGRVDFTADATIRPLAGSGIVLQNGGGTVNLFTADTANSGDVDIRAEAASDFVRLRDGANAIRLAVDDVTPHVDITGDLEVDSITGGTGDFIITAAAAGDSVVQAVTGEFVELRFASGNQGVKVNSGNGNSLMQCDTSADSSLIRAEDNTTRLEVTGTGGVGLIFNTGAQNSGRAYLESGASSARWSYGGGQSITLGAVAVSFTPNNGRVILTGDAGGNTIATITSTNFSDGDVLRVHVLVLGGGVAFTDNGGTPAADQMALAGTFTATVNSSIDLMFTAAGYWIETGRAVN